MKLIINIDEDYVKIINKNGASNYPEEVIKNGTPLDDVLDKIRAEIDQKQYDFMADKDYDEGIRFGLMLAYQIIDKHREGEQK